MALLELSEFIEQKSSNTQRIFLQTFISQHVEDGQAHRAGNWIATEGAEKFHSIVECVRDFAPCDNCSEGKGIADRLTEHNDVRHGMLRFESPEVRAEPAETDLYFVGDADAACCADVTIDFGQIVRRKNDLPADTGKRFGNIGWPLALRLQCAAGLADMCCVSSAKLAFASAMDPAIVV